MKDDSKIDVTFSEPPERKSRRTYTVDGRVYANLKTLADAAGISYQAAVKRHHRGFSDHEIFHGREKKTQTNDKKSSQSDKQISVHGVLYKSLSDAYDKLNPKATFNAVRQRLQREWSLEQALEVENKLDGRKAHGGTIHISVLGEKLNLAEAAAKYQIPYSTVLNRLGRGATPEQALGLEVIKDGDIEKQSTFNLSRKKFQKKIYTVDGVSFDSVSKLAKYFNLSYAFVYNRMRINGWSAERSVKEPTNSVVINGIRYKSAMNAWENIGKTSLTTYQGRKATNFPLDVCLGLTPFPSQQVYEVDGREFPSLGEVANAYNLTVAQLSNRLRDMPLEEAVKHIPSNGRYSAKKFKNSPTLARTIGVLYFVKIPSSGGVLHKIGITQGAVSSRLGSRNFVLIKEFQGELEQLFFIEQEILKTFHQNHYRADESFEGRTETFLLLDDEELKMLKEIRRLLIKHGIKVDA